MVFFSTINQTRRTLSSHDLKYDLIKTLSHLHWWLVDNTFITVLARSNDVTKERRNACQIREAPTCWVSIASAYFFVGSIFFCNLTHHCSKFPEKMRSKDSLQVTFLGSVGSTAVAAGSWNFTTIHNLHHL